MELKHEQIDGVTVVQPVAQRIDIGQATVFKNGLLSLIDDGHLNLVLNLNLIEFMDSSGLSAIIAVMKSLTGRGKISLTGLNPILTGIFRSTRMDRLIPIHPTLAEAVAAIK